MEVLKKVLINTNSAEILVYNSQMLQIEICLVSKDDKAKSAFASEKQLLFLNINDIVVKNTNKSPTLCEFISNI